eukprot:708130-Prymnesium_polylepis.1
MEAAARRLARPVVNPSLPHSPFSGDRLPPPQRHRPAVSPEHDAWGAACAASVPPGKKPPEANFARKPKTRAQQEAPRRQGVADATWTGAIVTARWPPRLQHAS